LVPNQRPAACGYDFYNNTDRDPEANGTYSTYQFRDATFNILENHPKDAPLFLYLPFQSVHYPLMVPTNYSGKYRLLILFYKRIFLEGSKLLYKILARKLFFSNDELHFLINEEIVF